MCCLPTENRRVTQVTTKTVLKEAPAAAARNLSSRTLMSQQASSRLIRDHALRPWRAEAMRGNEAGTTGDHHARWQPSVH